MFLLFLLLIGQKYVTVQGGRIFIFDPIVVKVLEHELKNFTMEPAAKSVAFESDFIQTFFIQLVERILYFSPELIQKKKTSPLLKQNTFSGLFDENILVWLTTEWV